MKSIKRQGLFIFVVLLVFIIGMFTGCGSLSSAKNSVAQSTASSSSANISNGHVESQKPSAPDQSGINSAGSQSENANSSRAQLSAVDPSSKIIKNGTLDIETKDFMGTVNGIINKASQCGGYLESSNIMGTSINNGGTYQNRTASLKLRIPQKYFLQFIDDAGKLENVTHSSTSSENVTYQYYDTEAHVKALTTEEDRLLELLKKTGELKDILELEKELANVRYQIEDLTGTIKKLDNLVDYSTLEVSVNEVQEVQLVKKAPITFWDRTAAGFVDSLKFMVSMFKGILIGAAYALPFIVLAAIVFFIAKRLKIAKRFKIYKERRKDDDSKSR